MEVGVDRAEYGIPGPAVPCSLRNSPVRLSIMVASFTLPAFVIPSVPEKHCRDRDYFNFVWRDSCIWSMYLRLRSLKMCVQISEFALST